jgi:hypothetical protein
MTTVSGFPGDARDQRIRWLEANIRIALMVLGKDDDMVRQVLVEALEGAGAVLDEGVACGDG